MRSLKSASVKGKRVLVRTDFNVPDFSSPQLRISRAIPTLRHLVASGAKVIMLTHAARNDGYVPSLAPLARHLRKKYFMNLVFCPAVIGSKAQACAGKMKNGDILLLENVRMHHGEKVCDKKFASSLASLGDIYVNEAFPESHRAYASIVLLPKLLPSYSGFLFASEIEHLSRAFKPKHPFVLILGGGKVEIKIPLLKKFSQVADQILLGGVAANVFLERPLVKLRNAVLPDDGVLQVGGKKKNLPMHEIKDKMKIWDIGSQTFSLWEEIIQGARFIVWNGPLGFIEKGFWEGTARLYKALKKATKAEIIIGGGDTLATLPLVLPPHIFVSTGGGAMLEFLAKETLPGIEALKS